MLANASAFRKIDSGWEQQTLSAVADTQANEIDEEENDVFHIDWSSSTTEQFQASLGQHYLGHYGNPSIDRPASSIRADHC